MRLVGGIAAAVVAYLVAAALGGPGPRAHPDGAAAVANGAARTAGAPRTAGARHPIAPGQAVPGQAAPGQAAPGQAAPGQAVPPGQAGALALARRFVVAWWTSDWDDPPDALASRVATMVTPALAQRLAGNGAADAPVLEAAVAAAHRDVRVAGPVAVVAGTVGADLDVDVTATASAAASPGGGAQTGRVQPVQVALDLLEAPAPGGWAVAGVEQ